MRPPGPDVRQTGADSHRRPLGCQLAARLWRRARALLAAAAVLARRPRAHGACRRGATCRVLVVLAAFPDRPLAHDRARTSPAPDALVGCVALLRRRSRPGGCASCRTSAGPSVTLPRAARRATCSGRPRWRATRSRRSRAPPTDPADARALARGADALIVFFAGPGRESHVAGRRSGRSRGRTTPPSTPPVGAASTTPACIAEEEVPPFSPFGVLCHEFGHLLGLPELYAPGRRDARGHRRLGPHGAGHVARPRRPAAAPRRVVEGAARLGRRRDDRRRRRRASTLPAVDARAARDPHPGRAGRPAGILPAREPAARGRRRARCRATGSSSGTSTSASQGFRSGAARPRAQAAAPGRGRRARRPRPRPRRRRQPRRRGRPVGGPPRWRRRLGAALALAGRARCWPPPSCASARPRAAAGRCCCACARGRGAPRRGGVRCAAARSAGPAPRAWRPTTAGRRAWCIRNLSPAGPEMRFDVLVAPAGDAG